MGEARHTRSRHARPHASRVVLWFALAGLALVSVGAVAGYLVGRGGAPAGAAPGAAAPRGEPVAAASPAPPGRPTLIAQVIRVAAGDEVMVSAGGVEEPVRVLGLDAPDLASGPGAAAPQCGSSEALAFADARLNGQTVTLVPDPTLPERDERGARLAYIVLRSQLNYTDAALIEGIGRADVSRPLWYAEVFAREQGTAVDERRGIWGAPCNQTP